MKTTEEERRAMRETTHPSYVDDLLDDLDAAEREREELARGVIRYAAEIVRLVPREQVVVIAMLLKKLVTPPATPSGTSALDDLRTSAATARDNAEANAYHQALGAKWMQEAIVHEYRTTFAQNRNAQAFANDLDGKWRDKSYWHPVHRSPVATDGGPKTSESVVQESPGRTGQAKPPCDGRHDDTTSTPGGGSEEPGTSPPTDAGE